MRQLAVTADDFGLTRQLDGGIKQACVEGIVTHVSLIANGESTNEASQFLAQHPETTAGAHLNLTDGRPLTNPSQLRPLVDRKGNFLRAHWRVGMVCLARPSLIKAIEMEYRAQVERLLGLGLRLFQLNCHGHLHALPTLFRLVTQLASAYKIPFVRIVDEWPSAVSLFRRPQPAVKTLFLTSSFKWAGWRITQTENRGKSNRCSGVFNSGHLTLKRFEEILAHLPDGFSELLCHPGVADEDVKKTYPWNYQWDEERRLLTSEKLRERIKQKDIHLVNFGSLERCTS